MEKIIYEVCPHCGKKNKCYKYPEIFKGRTIYVIECSKLKSISKKAMSDYEKNYS